MAHSQSKLHLILANIDSSVLQLWPIYIAECQTVDDLLRFLRNKLGDNNMTPTWGKKEKFKKGIYSLIIINKNIEENRKNN